MVFIQVQNKWFRQLICLVLFILWLAYIIYKNMLNCWGLHTQFKHSFVFFIAGDCVGCAVQAFGKECYLITYKNVELGIVCVQSKLIMIKLQMICNIYVLETDEFSSSLRPQFELSWEITGNYLFYIDQVMLHFTYQIWSCER